VDCAAIDSTVLQMARGRDRPMADGIRTVARLGPYPMPLWAFTERGDPAARPPIVAALCEMHQDDTGRHLLAQWQIAQLMAVNPQAYEPLRLARALAQQLAW
jgi:ABC-type phosphate/phosphonate transport system substrate-binding protein